MKDGIDGVINVVCYGYHEYRLAPGKAIKKGNKVRKTYLERHRQIEINARKKANFSLLSTGSPVSMLIVFISSSG